jgi:hypothetical protein
VPSTSGVPKSSSSGSLAALHMTTSDEQLISDADENLMKEITTSEEFNGYDYDHNDDVSVQLNISNLGSTEYFKPLIKQNHASISNRSTPIQLPLNDETYHEKHHLNGNSNRFRGEEIHSLKENNRDGEFTETDSANFNFSLQNVSDVTETETVDLNSVGSGNSPKSGDLSENLLEISLHQPIIQS